MDQGFAPQGFSATPSASTVEEAGVAARKAIESARGRVPQPISKPYIPSSPAAGESGASAASNAIQGMKPTVLETAAKGSVSAVKKNQDAKNIDPSQQEVARLQKTKSTFMMPATLEIVGMLGGGALGWVTSKLGWKKATAAIGMVFKAPTQALRNTSIGGLFRLPSNYLKAASQEAAGAGEKAAGWAEGASKRAVALEQSATALESRAASFAAPLRRTVGNGIEAFESTSVGKGLHGAVDRVMHSRKAAAVAKHDAVFAKAQTALTTQASVGWKQSISGFVSKTFKRTSPATVEAGELSHIMHELNAAKGNHAELKAVASRVESLVAGKTLSPEAAARAGNVSKHLGKLIGSAQALDTYGNAASGSMKTIAKAMGKAVSRIPVFNALLTVGVAAGVGATLVAANAESKQAKEAFADLSNQLGNSNSGFLQAVKNAQKSQGMMGTLKTGVKLVGDVADGVMFMLPGGGGVAMMGAVMIPQLCESLVPENKLLGAYVALQKNEAGELQLAPDGKVEAIRYLVAAMPAVAAKGGFYNRLSKPIAEEIVARNLSTADTVKLFGDEAAFTALASEVAAKQAQTMTADAKAKTANDNPKTTTIAAAEAPHHPVTVKAQAAMTSAEQAYHQAEKPANFKIAANDAQLAGKATVAQHQVG